MIEINKTYKSEWEIPVQSWEKFVTEAFDTESGDQNFKYPFPKMTKMFGRQFIEYCRASWVTCKDFMSPEEFCKINGNMPIGFFKSKIDIF